MGRKGVFGTRRVRIRLVGAVQGVGFRPFVHRLARAHGLSGHVRNTGDGVCLEVEGDGASVARFIPAVTCEAPPPARVASLELVELAPCGDSGFVIRPSGGGQASAWVLPDQATCATCLAEVRDPSNRRFAYPFTNCTRCGPRYTIMHRLPYDRVHTTMAGFAMCRACQAEYDDPQGRRHHAQPNACPACGPQLRLTEPTGRPLAQRDAALVRAAELLLGGAVLAVKGIGGFHLMVNAADHGAVTRLRTRKRRPHKPLAVMLASQAVADLHCRVDDLERAQLTSAAAPIVLAERRAAGGCADPIAACVAPDSPDLGILLAYSPLHHLLLQRTQMPLVATSGNHPGEPICTTDQTAYERLGAIADAVLTHDRPIARPCEDSVVRVMAGQVTVLRRGRGLSPSPVGRLARAGAGRVVAMGGHLKSAVAALVDDTVVLGPHLGDLESPRSRRQHSIAAADMLALFPGGLRVVAADQHPDYGTRACAAAYQRHGAELHETQHHAAHLWACLLDNAAEPPCLGVVWDGAGLGTDGSLWGGEFLHAQAEGTTRVACLRPFPLVGGDRAARDPRRAALSLLHALGPEPGPTVTATATWAATEARERSAWWQALSRSNGLALTSSVGRLFDGVASILGLCQDSSYEGQAAVALEHAARRAPPSCEPYPMPFEPVKDGAPMGLDWRPMLAALLSELASGISAPHIAARFHRTLSEAIVAVAKRMAIRRVALSGGCFQNTVLLTQTVWRLRAHGFEPLWHHQIPPNDGGLAAGQLALALRDGQPVAGAGASHAPELAERRKLRCV